MFRPSLDHHARRAFLPMLVGLLLAATTAQAGTKVFVGTYNGLERYDTATGERHFVFDLPPGSNGRPGANFSYGNVNLNVASLAHDGATGVVYAIVAPTIFELNVPTTGERIVRVPTSGDDPELVLSLEGTDRPEALVFDPLGALRFRVRKAGGVIEQRSLNLATGTVTVLSDTRTPALMTPSTIYFVAGDTLVAESRSTSSTQIIATIPGLQSVAIDEDSGVAFASTRRVVSGCCTDSRTITRVSLSGTSAPVALLTSSTDSYGALAADPITRRVHFRRYAGLSLSLQSIAYDGGAVTTVNLAENPWASGPDSVAFAVGAPASSLTAKLAPPPSVTNVAWSYTMGARFVAERDGVISQLGGHFTGTKIVRLFRDADRALLAQVNVTGAGTAFAYAPITPVTLVAGETYVVAVVLAGSGGSQSAVSPAAPSSVGGLRFLGSVYAYTAGQPDAYPTTQTVTMHYGIADVKFSAAGFVAPPGPPSTAVWAPQAGTATGPVAWSYTMGYAFTPQVSGKASAIGGRFIGTKRVRLYDDVTQAVLAETMVTSSGAFAYADINVNLVAGRRYVVAVSLAGSGGFYEYVAALPRAHGSVVIEGGRYAPTNINPEAYPSTNASTVLYGQADVRFVPDEPTTADQAQWRRRAPLMTTLTNEAFAGGLRFVPTQNVWLTAFGGRFRGSVPVELYDVATGTMISSATVVGAGNYTYVDVTPVRLTAGRRYLVVARVETSESTDEFLRPAGLFPRTQGLVTFEAALTGPLTGMPVNNQASSVFGVPDFKLAQ